MLRLLTDFGGLWAELYPAEQAPIVKALVKQVVAAGDGLEVR